MTNGIMKWEKTDDKRAYEMRKRNRNKKGIQFKVMDARFCSPFLERSYWFLIFFYPRWEQLVNNFTLISWRKYVLQLIVSRRDIKNTWLQSVCSKELFLTPKLSEHALQNCKRFNQIYIVKRTAKHILLI